MASNLFEDFNSKVNLERGTLSQGQAVQMNLPEPPGSGDDQFYRQFSLALSMLTAHPQLLQAGQPTQLFPAGSTTSFVVQVGERRYSVLKASRGDADISDGDYFQCRWKIIHNDAL